MSHRVPLRRVLRSLLVLATVLAVASGVRPTYALFTDQATMAAGTAAGAASAFTSGSITTPVTPTATQSATGVTLSWSATSVGNGSATASSYEVYRYAAALGGTGTLVCTTTALTCNDAAQAGTVHYAVRAKFAATWTHEGARRAFTADTTVPTITPVRPLQGESFNNVNALRTAVTGSCSAGGVACFTVSDPSGLASVTYRLSRTRAQVTMCWSQTGGVYSWSGTSACPTYSAAGGSGSAYNAPGPSTTAYTTGPATYVLDIRATDVNGNVANLTVSFTQVS